MLDNVGLIHMNGRVYDPNVGRFLSTDPLISDFGDSQSVNPYAYVGNRPLNHAAATGVLFKAIAGTRGLLHSFDRYAAQWFGREVGASTHLVEWQSVLERASRSSLQVSWSTGADATVGYLARIDGKYIFTQFYVGGPRAGELATAFVPDQAQLAQIFQLLGF